MAEDNTNLSPSDPFYSLLGVDGFRVTQTVYCGKNWLSVVCYAEGEQIPNPGNETIACADTKDMHAIASVERLRHLLESVCRYFNTGGTWTEFDQTIEKTRKLVSGGLLFPGYHLVCSNLTTDGYQHIFATDDGSGKAIVWNEPEIGESGVPVGGWIEPTTLRKIRDEQEEDEVSDE